jgi:hypothetical protein
MAPVENLVKAICEQPNTKAHGLDARKEISSSANTFRQKNVIIATLIPDQLH